MEMSLKRNLKSIILIIKLYYMKNNNELITYQKELNLMSFNKKLEKF